MTTQIQEEFSIASERWQVLEKERLEIRRQRELIEHRIDLRFHSETGLEHHKSDYMKRLLKKVEDNYEKSKLRNRQLVAKADQVLNDANMAQSTHLVSSKVKLEVAKKQFLQNFQLRLHEFEALSRQEKLRQIRKAEEEIELQKQKSRTSQLEWEREKKLNNDLQEKVKELIITKEQAKKEAIEREAERKAILSGERNVQRMSEQASLDASKRFMEKQEKKKKSEATDGKEIKNVIDDVYEGKIANAREKFVTAAIMPNRSDDLYYNDGYSSMEEKHSATSFAKFKEWQKKQMMEKNSKTKDLDSSNPRTLFEKNESSHSYNTYTEEPEEVEEIKERNEREVTSTIVASPLLKQQNSSPKAVNVKKQDMKETESSPPSKPHSARPITPTKKEIQAGQSFVRLQSPKRIASSPTRPFSDLTIEKGTESQEELPGVPSKQQPSTPTPTITITPTGSIPPKFPSPSPETQPNTQPPSQPTTTAVVNSTDNTMTAPEEEVPQKSLNPKQKLKSILSVFKLTKKKQDEPQQQSESSSEAEQNAQDKDDNNTVCQKLKKMNVKKLIPPLQHYMREIEETLKEQKEKFNKMSLNYKLEHKDNIESLCYLNCPKTNVKQRVQSVENIKSNLTVEQQCLAVLDIIQYSPVSLLSLKILEASESEKFNLQELENVAGEQVSGVWHLIIHHINTLSKVEPKWKEPLLKLFSEALCKSIVPSSQCTSETKNKTKYILKNLMTKARNDVVVERNVQSARAKMESNHTDIVQSSLTLPPTMRQENTTTINSDEDEEKEASTNATHVTQSNRPSSASATNKVKKTSRLITSVSAFNPTTFAKLNKNILGGDDTTSDSDVENILRNARPRSVSDTAHPVSRTSTLPSVNSGGTMMLEDDDDVLDF